MNENRNTVVTADLFDQYGESMAGIRILLPVFRDYGGVTAFSGPVVTIKTYEDNSLVREAVFSEGNGAVLVVDGGESLRYALMGDQLAQGAYDNGWVGVVIAGCVRDASVLRDIPVGVKAMATTPRKSLKRGQGMKNVPIEIAGALIKPGEWLYADEDGILVAPERLGG